MSRHGDGADHGLLIGYHIGTARGLGHGYGDEVTSCTAARPHVARVHIGLGGHSSHALICGGGHGDGHRGTFGSGGYGSGRISCCEADSIARRYGSYPQVIVGVGTGRRPGAEREDEGQHQSCYIISFHIMFLLSLLYNFFLSIEDIDSLTLGLSLELAAVQVVPVAVLIVGIHVVDAGGRAVGPCH